MERDTALTVVRVLAVLEWVGAAFGFVMAALFLIGGPLLASTIVTEEPSLATLGGGMLGAVFIALGVFLLALSVVGLLTGIGLWRLRNWGRILALIVSWLSAVWSAFALVGSAVGADAPDVFWNLVGVALAGVWIWLLQFQADVVALFQPVPVVVKRAAKKKR